MHKILQAPLLLIGFICLSCANDDGDPTPPRYSDELAISRLESVGNVVYAGDNNKLNVFQVSANGQFQELTSVQVSGQVQNLLAVEDRLFVALPEKAAAYSVALPNSPQWQYQVEANPLTTNLGYASGYFGVLHIADTTGSSGLYSNQYQGLLTIHNSSQIQPIYEVVTPYRESRMLATAPGAFLVGEEEQLLVFQTDSLQSSYISQTLNLRMLGLQATPSGLVATASAAPRVLSFYQLQQGQLHLLSQLPLAP